jgi:hypothetical protein
MIDRWLYITHKETIVIGRHRCDDNHWSPVGANYFVTRTRGISNGIVG